MENLHQQWQLNDKGLAVQLECATNTTSRPGADPRPPKQPESASKMKLNLHSDTDEVCGVEPPVPNGCGRSLQFTVKALFDSDMPRTKESCELRLGSLSGEGSGPSPRERQEKSPMPSSTPCARAPACAKPKKEGMLPATRSAKTMETSATLPLMQIHRREACGNAGAAGRHESVAYGAQTKR